MATILVPEQESTIMGAVAVSRSGDVISIAAGTYSEYVAPTVTGLVFTGRTTDPSQVVITSAPGATHTVNLASSSGTSIGNLTVNFTNGGSGARYGIVSTSAVVVVSNVVVNTDCSGIGPLGWGSTIDRCKVTCTYKSTSNTTYGIYQTASSGSGTPTSIGSTLVVDFNWAQIYARYTTIVNTTTHTSYKKNASLIGAYASHLYNVASVSDVTGGWAGIRVNSSGSSTNCLAFGWASASNGDFYLPGGTTNTNNLDSSDVTSSGESVFADASSDDFHIDPAGVAYHSGSYTFQSTYSAFLNDLDGVRFEDPPSRGAYEHVAAAGGTTTNARCRLGLKLGI